MQVPEFPIYQCEINAGISIQPESSERFFKHWLDHPKLGRCLLKIALEDETSPNHQALDWREKFASEFGKLLGLPMAQIELASIYIPGQDRWVRGTLSIDYAPPGSQIVSLRQFLNRVDANYDRSFNDAAETSYTVENVIKQLELHSVGFPPNWKPLEGISTIGDLFIGYLWFDALLGATERHDRSIEIARSDSGYTLCPSFDYGDCLGSKLPLSQLSDNYDDRRLTESCWWQTQEIRNRQQFVKISNLEAFLIASDDVTGEARYVWQQTLRSLNTSEIDNVFARFPAERLAPAVPKLIKNYIWYNRRTISHYPSLERAIIRTGIVIDPEANKTITGLYLGWRDYETDKWFPIQKMTALLASWGKM